MFPTIALGSKSPLKVEATDIAFRHFSLRAPIESFDVPSGVSKQPFGFGEMYVGARNRAMRALDASPSSYLGIGLENGIMHLNCGVNENHFDVTMAVIVNRHGAEWIGYGPGFPVPRWAVDEARGSELGDVVMKRGAKDKNPMAFFSGGRIDRKETLSWALKSALASYVYTVTNR